MRWVRLWPTSSWGGLMWIWSKIRARRSQLSFTMRPKKLEKEVDVAATKADIRGWFEQGLKDSGKTHMVVVCDTYDWDDYPVYIAAKSAEDAREQARALNKNMQSVMEVYNLGSPMEPQMAQRRAFNY